MNSRKDLTIFLVFLMISFSYMALITANTSNLRAAELKSSTYSLEIEEDDEFYYEITLYDEDKCEAVFEDYEPEKIESVFEIYAELFGDFKEGEKQKFLLNERYEIIVSHALNESRIINKGLKADFFNCLSGPKKI